MTQLLALKKDTSSLPSFLDIKLRIFIVCTDVSGQPIGFIFKGLAFQEQCRATGGYVTLQGMVQAVIGCWGCKRANQVPGAKSCHKDVERENVKRDVGDTRTKVEKGRKLERSVPYGLG